VRRVAQCVTLAHCHTGEQVYYSGGSVAVRQVAHSLQGTYSCISNNVYPNTKGAGGQSGIVTPRTTQKIRKPYI